MLIQILLETLPGWSVLLAFLLALFFTNKERAYSYTALRYLFLFNIALQGLWAFIYHTFFPSTASASIGWSVSPFEYEVGLVNLGFAVLGCMAFFKGRFDFWLATIVIVTVFLFGAGLGHLYQLVYRKDLAPSNAGLIMYTDLIMPPVYILLYCLARFSAKNQKQ
ncbi:MAG: hypothetical protein S4CHLAM7_15550 [Chlamydiae bacterium]|nr:hypothetical protein [Chlamydiota bacterium]